VREQNVGVNDVMGDYALTLVDSLDTFAVRLLYCSILSTLRADRAVVRLVDARW